MTVVSTNVLTATSRSRLERSCRTDFASAVDEEEESKSVSLSRLSESRCGTCVCLWRLLKKSNIARLEEFWYSNEDGEKVSLGNGRRCGQSDVPGGRSEQRNLDTMSDAIAEITAFALYLWRFPYKCYAVCERVVGTTTDWVGRAVTLSDVPNTLTVRCQSLFPSVDLREGVLPKLQQDDPYRYQIRVHGASHYTSDHRIDTSSLMNAAVGSHHLAAFYQLLQVNSGLYVTVTSTQHQANVGEINCSAHKQSTQSALS